MNEKKILFLISSLKATGPNFVVATLANGFVKKGYVVTILSLSVSELELTLDEAISVEMMNLSHGKITHQNVVDYQKKEKKIGPKIVSSHGLRADVLNSLSKKMDPQVFRIATSHNNPFKDYLSKSFGLKGLPMVIMEFLAFTKMNVVVTLNPFLKSLHSIFLGKKKVVMIPNGVKKLQTEMNSRDIVDFGMVGNIDDNKNQEQLLRQATFFPDSNFVFWGVGPKRGVLMNKFPLSNVSFPGFSKNKELVYSSFSVFVSLSKSEGSPLAVLEAISAGKSLILSDIPAHRYIANQLPDAGFKLVKNEEDLKKAIETFRNDEIIKRNMNIMIKAYNEHFSDEVMVDRYYRLITENVGGKSL